MDGRHPFRPTFQKSWFLIRFPCIYSSKRDGCFVMVSVARKWISPPSSVTSCMFSHGAVFDKKILVTIQPQGIRSCSIIIVKARVLALARAPPGGRAGEQRSLGGAMDTGLTSLALGSRATLVARAIAANTELGTEMMGLCPEQRFLVDAHIDQDTLVTIYNAELSAAGQLPRLHLDNHAGWIAHSKPTHGAFFQLKELCAGLGGFSQGANFKTVACLDHSRLACDALRLQGHQVVHAQMEDMEALFKFHQIGSAQPCLLSAGFPCQPYSAQGDQQGMRDSRGQTLISILKASWYLQSVGLILECVHNARHNVDVQNLLAQYANLRRWQVHHVTLDLQDQWASKRKRWWCIMIPEDSRVPFVAQHQSFSQCLEQR